MKRGALVVLAVAALLLALLAIVVAPLAIRTLAFEPYTIPSAAMEPNLRQGDYVIVSKSAYGYSRHSIIGSPAGIRGRISLHSPNRGDVVVFKLPRDGRTSYIKRLVGMPGDKMQIQRGIVLINGVPLSRHIQGSITTEDRGYPEQATLVRESTPEGRSYLVQVHGAGEPQDNTGVYVVPSRCYFFLGDKRDNSADSRFDPRLPANDLTLGGCGWDQRLDAQIGDESGVGFVPEANLVGRATMLIRRYPSGRLKIVTVQ